MEKGNCKKLYILQKWDRKYRTSNIWMWKLYKYVVILSALLRIDIKWKHILLDFFNESSNKVIFLNNLISFTALKIYKYKMFCRLEHLDETEYNIRIHLKFENVV